MIQFRLLVHITIMLTSAFASAQGLCRDFFADLAVPRFESHHLEEFSPVQGPFGKSILLQRKTQLKKRFLLPAKTELQGWGDFAMTSDRGGDPRWGAEFLPPYLKEFMAFKTLDSNRRAMDALSKDVQFVEVPAPESIPRRLTRLQKTVQEHAGRSIFSIINFYKTSGDILDGRHYLENFVSAAKLPLANNGQLFEHDLNYHVLSSLVLPNQVTQALRKRAKLFLKFLEFTKKQSTHSKRYETLHEKLEEELLPELVSRIDVSTGNMGHTILAGDINKRMNDVMASLDESMSIAFLERGSPMEFLEKFVGSSALPLFKSQAIEDFRTEVPETYFNRDLSTSFLHNPAEVYNLGREHLKGLEKAAEFIAKNPSN